MLQASQIPKTRQRQRANGVGKCDDHHQYQQRRRVDGQTKTASVLCHRKSHDVRIARRAVDAETTSTQIRRGRTVTLSCTRHASYDVI